MSEFNWDTTQQIWQGNVPTASLTVVIESMDDAIALSIEDGEHFHVATFNKVQEVARAVINERWEEIYLN